MATNKAAILASQPLPAGWQAKYDAEQKRFYFINHSTRTTTWDDPRQTAWQQPAHTSNFAHSSGGDGFYSSPKKSPNKHPDYNAWEKHVENKYGLKVQHIKEDDGETSFSNSGSPILDQRVLHNLKADYLLVDPEVIKDTLRSVHNDEAKARFQLKSMGFVSTPIPKHPYSSPQKTAVDHSHGKHKSHKSMAPEPPCGLTNTQKVKLREKLVNEFSNCAASVVEMALDASQYSEAKARILLKSMASDIRHGGKENSPGMKEGSNALETPVYATVNKQTQNNVVSGKEPAPKTSVSSSSTTSTSNMLTSSDFSSSRKEQLSKKIDRSKPSRAPELKTSSQSKGEYRSKNCIQPVGPNPKLWKGPDMNNILDAYLPIHGPDPNNHHGSQHALLSSHHPITRGPNRFLAKGPDPHLVQGPTAHMAHAWTTETQSPITCGSLINALCPSVASQD